MNGIYVVLQPNVVVV